MIHPDTELAFVSPEVGWGVFATRRIPRGTITWALDERDLRLPPERVGELTPEQERLAYQDHEGFWVLAWDHGRSVNHSCDPNCISGGEDGFEVAIRDIGPGEQLTDDYGELSGFPPFPCSCRSVLCRGTITPQPRRSIASRFRRRQLRDALALAALVEQPLGDLARSTRLLADLLAPRT